jgi:hypothetical protein
MENEVKTEAREYNPYEYITYFTETKQFRIDIPRAAYRPVCLSLAEAMQMRDRMIQSPHFPKAERFEPRTEFACYVDPNLETR